MPEYLYRCKCGEEEERVSSIKKMKSWIKCRACGARMGRVFSTCGVRFVGPGFYENDYKRKGEER